MGWVRVAVITATLALAVAAAPRAADACTPPPDGISARAVLPGDGVVDVPRNTRVLVVYESARAVPSDSLSLRPVGGAAVAVTVATPTSTERRRAVLLTPAATLEPSTTYELVDTVAVPCEEYDASLCVGAPVVVATFTTGAALDTTPPSIGGVTVASSARCPVDSCPDGTSPVIDQISVASIVGDSPASPVLYEYLGADGVVLAGPTALTPAGRDCGGGYFNVWEEYLELPAALTLRAVDLAGNVEAEGHAIDGATCALFEETCRPDDQEPDAGPSDGDGDGGGDDGGGCSTTSGGASVWLLALAAITARRRGRGTTRGAPGRAAAPTGGGSCRR